MINPKNPAKHPNLHTYHDLNEEIQDNHMALHSCPKHQPTRITETIITMLIIIFLCFLINVPPFMKIQPSSIALYLLFPIKDDTKYLTVDLY